MSTDDAVVEVRYNCLEWVVECPATGQPSRLHATRAEAEREARELAMELAPCWLRIYTTTDHLHVACHFRGCGAPRPTPQAV